MVRLVFRPYPQVWRSICTSESLRASTRVSSGFALLKHSSPSFGSQHICSYSNLSKSRIGRSMMRCSRSHTSHFDSLRNLYFHYASRVSVTRRLAHMSDSLVRVSRRVAWNHMTANDLSAFVHTPHYGNAEVHVHCKQSTIVTTNTSTEGQPKRARTATPLSGASQSSSAITQPPKGLLPSQETYHWLRTLVDAPARKVRCQRNGAHKAQSFGSATPRDHSAGTWISNRHC